MPEGPLGFPRLTRVGPLVTDGGEREPKVGEAVMWTDDSHEEFRYGDVIIPSNIKGDQITAKREAEAGRYTMTKEEFVNSTREP